MDEPDTPDILINVPPARVDGNPDTFGFESSIPTTSLGLSFVTPKVVTRRKSNLAELQSLVLPLPDPILLDERMEDDALLAFHTDVLRELKDTFDLCSHGRPSMSVVSSFFQNDRA